MKTIYAVLSVRSWKAFDPDARHWYGVVSCDGESHELKRTLSSSATAAMNKQRKDMTFRWQRGQSTLCFMSEEAVIRHAKKTWKKLFPKAKFLLLGCSATLDPQLCLDGPKRIKDRINKFYQRSQEIGGYEVDEKEMDKNSDRYMREILGFKC